MDNSNVRHLLRKIKITYQQNNTPVLRKLFKKLLKNSNDLPSSKIKGIITNIIIYNRHKPQNGKKLYVQGVGDIDSERKIKEILRTIKVPNGYLKKMKQYKHLQNILSKVKVLINKKLPSLSENLHTLTNPKLSKKRKQETLQNIESLGNVTGNTVVKKVHFKLQNSSIDNIFKSAKNILNSL